jgi:hypothetical protein
LGGDFAQQEQFVEIIDLDHRAFVRRALQDFAALQRAVENDVVSRNAVLPRLVVFKFRDDFGNRTLLVKNAADRVEIVGLVGPGELNVGIAAGKRAVSFPVFGPQRRFGKNEKRTAVLARQLRDRNAVDFRTTRRGAEPERIARFGADALDGGREIGAVSCEGFCF